MQYITGQEALVIHARIIDTTGGLHGVRDIHLLQSLLERPKMSFGGRDLYRDVFDKAAAYFESCAYHHIFIDGNKRTAIALAARFLFLNGCELSASNREVEVFALRAVEKKIDVSTISAWLKKHSQRIKK